MQIVNTILDTIYCGILQPLFLGLKGFSDLVFLKSRDALYTCLTQHYFRYVLIFLIPLFLLPSQPFGMQGVPATLLFLVSYVFSLIIGLQLKKRILRRRK